MKNWKSITLIILSLCIYSTWVNAQTNYQTIRGTVLDKESEIPLIGATISWLHQQTASGTATDLDGKFKLEDIPVGRHSFSIDYLGYESIVLNEIQVTSGKEVVLNLRMIESSITMDEVVVRAVLDKSTAINEMAAVSARSFSVEETSRYAGAFNDPARMAMNYAGVSLGGGEDLFNEIVVRGNSSRGMLWKLEGIEIPNPNHFGSLGSSGGAISMLSSSILSNSDFYTGAFPAEFGNAASGVFDLRMRKGNDEKAEYAFMLGALGIEAAAEGPIAKGSGSSYLINYRYSTLGALDAIGISPAGDVTPIYSDLSFKVNIATKNIGSFTMFGLGGKNSSSFDPEADSTIWVFDDDKWGFIEKQSVGTIGLGHRILLSNNSYLYSVIAGSTDRTDLEEYYLDKNNNYNQILDEKGALNNDYMRASILYNSKINARNTLRVGLIAAKQKFDLKYEYFKDSEERFVTLFDNKGDAMLLQGYGQWKFKFSPLWTLNAGVHYTYYDLNQDQSLEPRLSLQYDLSAKHKLSFAWGIHSRPEHASFYYLEQSAQDGTRTSPNQDVELMKAIHAVVGHDWSISKDWRVKTEIYYQDLSNVPVEKTIGSTRSIINSADIWDITGSDPADNSGSGRNYGVDFTLEKFFSKDYYGMLTASVFESKYTPKNGIEYDTRFNGNYQFNVLGGKEFVVGKKGNNRISINGKALLSGGRRITPIDLEASKEVGYTMRDWTRPYSQKTADYFRMDLSLSYKINRPKLTHSISFDIQNVTNRLNEYAEEFNDNTQQIEKVYQTGLFPNFNYRIEF